MPVCHPYVLWHSCPTEWYSTIFKEGVNTFREKGMDEVLDEIRQMHTYETFKPVKQNKLTWEKHGQALWSLMYL